MNVIFYSEVACFAALNFKVGFCLIASMSQVQMPDGEVNSKRNKQLYSKVHLQQRRSNWKCGADVQNSHMLFATFYATAAKALRILIY